MGKLRNVKISYRDGKCQELSVDGVDMRYCCIGYKLEHKGGQMPLLTLEVRCGSVQYGGDDESVEPRLIVQARPDFGSTEWGESNE